MIACTRPRVSNVSSARGAASMITEAVGTARAAGCTGTIVVRMDSAFYGSPACSAARRAGARFSVTARTYPKVRATIAAVGEDAWDAIRYPRAIWDDQLGRWASDAQDAEVPYTASTSRTGQAMIARPDRAPRQGSQPGAGRRQGELFTASRYHRRLHPTRRSRPSSAEEQHRGHAQAEQVFADWTDGPLAHLPSVKPRIQCVLTHWMSGFRASGSGAGPGCDAGRRGGRGGMRCRGQDARRGGRG